MGEFETAPALSTTAGSTTPTLLATIHAAVAEALGIALDTPFTGAQVPLLSIVTATPGANKIVKSTALGVIDPGWLPVRRCHARHTGQSLTTGSSWVAILFDAEDYDTDTFHSTSANQERLVAPVDGVYAVSLYGGFSSNAVFTTAGLKLAPSSGVNFEVYQLSQAAGWLVGGSYVVVLTVSFFVYLTAGQYVSCSCLFEGAGSSNLLLAKASIAQVR